MLLEYGFLYDYVNARVYWRITGKYGGSAHRDCNIKLKLIRKIQIVFQI